jgi:uncharacterized protein (DUF433 family)
MKLPTGIEINKDIMMGKPCVAGTRIPVYLVLQKIAADETFDDLLTAYPQLTKAGIMACIQYAAGIASEEIVIAQA